MHNIIMFQASSGTARINPLLLLQLGTPQRLMSASLLFSIGSCFD
jgi:hypothetical protein